MGDSSPSSVQKDVSAYFSVSFKVLLSSESLLYHTLTEWHEMQKSQFVAICNHYNMPSLGSRKVLAHRLFHSFRAAMSTIDGVCAGVVPSTSEQSFVRQESSHITMPTSLSIQTAQVQDKPV